LAAADHLSALSKRAARGLDLSAPQPSLAKASVASEALPNTAATASIAGHALPASAATVPNSPAIAGTPTLQAATSPQQSSATPNGGLAATMPGSAAAAAAHSGAAIADVPASQASTSNGIETAKGERLDLLFETKRCIHARFCVTGAPKVFLANVQGPWLRPDAMEVERVVEIAHACPSGAIQYRRRDGVHDEPAPPVNLASIRESGPYAFRGQLQIDGESCGFRATLCRCGASKNKPFCDSSHHEAGFGATGEPASGATDMLPVRDGPLAIELEINGPLSLRGNLEITSGTGRVVARVESTKLCRCGGSATKPFCDGTHARIGFVSTR
jgi:CDGSH-type Zn-finger protein/uncharacterized Fe-S cluster protein YjdI